MELINIIENRGRQLVSARELYEFLGLSRRFSLWIEIYIKEDNEYDFVEGRDFTSVRQRTLVNNGAERELQDYGLTINMAKELCLLSKSKRGREARKYFIKCEERLKYLTKESYLIDDPIERARVWIREKEEIERLRLENNINTSKVVFADAVAASKGTILVGELAKILKQNNVDTGQNKLFLWLRENGYLIKRTGSDYNMPTQKSMEQGLFAIKETSIIHSDGHVSITKTPKVTGKGQQYFINKFLKEMS